MVPVSETLSTLKMFGNSCYKFLHWGWALIRVMGAYSVIYGTPYCSTENFKGRQNAISCPFRVRLKKKSYLLKQQIWQRWAIHHNSIQFKLN